MVEGITSIFIAVVSGVLVFIIGEVLRDIWLMPLQEYKSLKSKISFALTYYAMYYANPIDSATCAEDLGRTYREASHEIRKLSSELRGFIETLSWIKLGIPQKENLYEASQYLIGLSNGFFCPYNSHTQHSTSEENLRQVKKIKNALKIYELERKQ